MSGPHIVALGGGHGLAATLSALRHLSDNVTAVVTVADDGGSSGRLRTEFGMLPPGDLRMAMAALTDDPGWGSVWRDVLQHRFTGDGPLGGHALGNLLIVALWQLNEDPVVGLDLLGHMLGARGRVLPMAAEPLQISASITTVDDAGRESVERVVGQAQVAMARGQVRDVALHPEQPKACPEAVRAIHDADHVVLGPGSWFTSVMPHLLVPELRAALDATSARRTLTLNVEMDTLETAGYTAVEHIESLHDLAPGFRLDTVLADPAAVEDEAALALAAKGIGAQLVIAPVASRQRRGVHDRLRLAAAYGDLIGGS